MNRVAVFVDAGYVFAQGSVLLAGKKLPRSEVVLEHEAAVQAFGEFASKISSVPLLRIYWYDGTSTGPTAQHLTLAHLPDIKLRLGFVNSVGEQKGVDSLIVTDMITLARNRAIRWNLLRQRSPERWRRRRLGRWSKHSARHTNFRGMSTGSCWPVDDQPSVAISDRPRKHLEEARV